MYQEINNLLIDLDKKFPFLTNQQLQREFENIPLEIFGGIQIDRPSGFENLLNWLPKMPSAEIQISWTGNSDHVLLKQSVNFIQLCVSKYSQLAHKPISQAQVLDFGCGWGRLIRLLYKYVPIENIYAVDPWERSLEICYDCNLYGNFYLSDYIPQSLPTPVGLEFDFILAFSVFTHLSERVTKISLATLSNYLADKGIIALTIRPREYWQFCLEHNPDFSATKITQLLDEYDEKGFSFHAHNREEIDGEITYGDTTISLSYIQNHFPDLEIVGVEWSEVDPLQMIVFLRKAELKANKYIS